MAFNGSARLTGGALGLQIRCGALKPSRVGSIPMHFRQNIKGDHLKQGDRPFFMMKLLTAPFLSLYRSHQKIN